MLALADEFEHRAIGEPPGATHTVSGILISAMSALMLLLRVLVRSLDVSGQYQYASLTRCPSFAAGIT